jgi:hypothetical protein
MPERAGQTDIVGVSRGLIRAVRQALSAPPTATEAEPHRKPPLPHAH